MDLVESTEEWEVPSSTQHKMFRSFPNLCSPEEHSSAVEILLDVLRTHAKHKESILDSIFLDTVKYYAETFDMKIRQSADTESGKAFNSAMETLQKTSKKIIKIKSAKPASFIVFFEAMIAVVPDAKTCADCKLHFHPHEDAETRTRCVYCM